MGRRLNRTELSRAFWIAAGVSLLLNVVPFGHYLLYPFALLGTWAHEMGHGLTARLLGGEFVRLELYADLGGVAFHRTADSGWRRALVAAGGLIGPAVAGGGVIVLGARPRTVRWVLGVLVVGLVGSVVVYVRNPFGVVGASALAVGFGALVLYGSEAVRLVVTQLVGIQLCMASLGTLDYMFTPGFRRDGEWVASDTQTIADQLFLPYWVWGALIAVASLGILAGAFWVAWVRDSGLGRARRAAS